MNGHFVFSLFFMKNYEAILSIDSLNKMRELVGFQFPEEITSLISTTDWYNFTDEDNAFDFLSERLSDSQHKSMIISKLSQIFSPHINADFNNSSAANKVLRKHDENHYYSIVNAFEITENFNECNLVENTSDYYQIHEKYLFLAPESNEDYASRCILLFDRVKFTSDFHVTLSTLGNGQGIIGYAEKITKAISTLNSINPEIREIGKVMHWIHERCGFECSEQGKNKKHLCPTVTLDDKSEIEINCEFHIKVNTRENGGQKTEHSRIYFGLMPYGQEKYCYIHHCGEHL
ncbi:hypothetical protein [Shewanella algae]|uniref:hypothetical protein n=1 Tax=Shewanella algae TaxID=38313 RepID=UPI001AAD75DB|nr:hypothetical protein [Shewanella algae]MBO2651203.1 hypothetical protein [Shewanella algae]